MSTVRIGHFCDNENGTIKANFKVDSEENLRVFSNTL